MKDEHPLASPAPAGRLDGRVAVVTGAGSSGVGIGNGRAAAILLARAGARVVVSDMELEAAIATEAMIHGEGREAMAVHADVTSPDACRSLIAATIAAYGRLDVLVNNVGIAGPAGTAVTVDIDEWHRGLLVNVTSMMLTARFAVPEMASRGGGSIINIGSVAGLRGGSPNLLYPTSKGAVVNMTRAMAVHHGPQGIRVNCVCPGLVYTPMVAEGGMSEERRDIRRRRGALKIEGTGWDTGAAVVYLASDEARWVTGVALPVDAGTTASVSDPNNEMDAHPTAATPQS